MRVGHLQQTRPAYYDRRPAPTGRLYNAGSIAPHSTTQRWTYTVPTGKAAYAEYAMARVMRETVATTSGIVQAFVRASLPGETPDLARAQLSTNTPGHSDALASGGQGMMTAGTVLEGFTADASTGGLCRFAVSLKLTEFDA